MVLVKIIGGILAVVILLLAIGAYFLFNGMCENTIISSSYSPNGKWKVVLFERSCGATTGFTSQISLFKPKNKLGNEGGNIYVADGYPKGYALNWESNTLVNIKTIGERSFLKLNNLNGITFHYE